MSRIQIWQEVDEKPRNSVKLKRLLDILHYQQLNIKTLVLDPRNSQQLSLKNRGSTHAVFGINSLQTNVVIKNHNVTKR
jgi:hypothetical protein